MLARWTVGPLVDARRVSISPVTIIHVRLGRHFAVNVNLNFADTAVDEARRIGRRKGRLSHDATLRNQSNAAYRLGAIRDSIDIATRRRAAAGSNQ